VLAPALSLADEIAVRLAHAPIPCSDAP